MNNRTKGISLAIITIAFTAAAVSTPRSTRSINIHEIIDTIITDRIVSEPFEFANLPGKK